MSPYHIYQAMIAECAAHHGTPCDGWDEALTHLSQLVYGDSKIAAQERIVDDFQRTQDKLRQQS